MDHLTLKGSLDYQSIRESHTQLAAWLAQGPDTLVLKLSSMQKLDVCGIQCLEALRLELESYGHSLMLAPGTEADRVNSLCNRIGLRVFQTEG